MARKQIVFDFFRYQLLPRRSQQLDIFGEHISLSELKERKNAFFSDVVLSEEMRFIESHGESLRHKIIGVNNDVIIMKLGRRKNVLLTNENLEDEEHPDFPSVYIVINNDPTIQKIAISRDIQAFSNSFVVANILEENFSRACLRFNLEVVVNPILDSADFWDLIAKYKDRIVQLKFNLIRPNLANISGTFKDEIRELTDSTNSLVTKVELNAPKGSTLENIDENNSRIKDLADYAIKGGSQSIHLKVTGLKKTIKTERTISTISIESAELSGSPDSINEALENLTRIE
jgi:hypothetical protein